MQHKQNRIHYKDHVIDGDDHNNDDSDDNIRAINETAEKLLKSGASGRLGSSTGDITTDGSKKKSKKKRMTKKNKTKKIYRR